jgi:[ribosomal protein S5]-alanine N-acetyltransferase
VPVPVLCTDRLEITLPAPEAAPRVLAFYQRNRDHLEPWEPPRPPEAWTEGHWRRVLARNLDEQDAGVSCRMFLFGRDGGVAGPILGQAALSQIFRGPFCSCMLGYALDRDHVGQGLMTEALQAVLDYAFGPLGLHRVQANYVPTNERSGATLRRLGFVVEGYARDYLYIAGAWRDHVLTARLNPGPVDPSR